MDNNSQTTLNNNYEKNNNTYKNNNFDESKIIIPCYNPFESDIR